MHLLLGGFDNFDNFATACYGINPCPSDHLARFSCPNITVSSFIPALPEGRMEKNPLR